MGEDETVNVVEEQDGDDDGWGVLEGDDEYDPAEGDITSTPLA